MTTQSANKQTQEGANPSLGNSDDNSEHPRGAQHTPTPWRIEYNHPFIKGMATAVHICGNYERSACGGQVYGDTIAHLTTKFAEGGRPMTEAEYMSNAALIVKAVNNHEALREALERAAESLADCANQFKGHGMIASYDVAKVYEAAARAALQSSQ